MDARYLTSADGSKLYVEAIGDPTKPCIVFIHGFTLSGAVFDNIFFNKDLIVPSTLCVLRLVKDNPYS